MTISYSGNFCRLLMRWRGSLWKAIFKELILYLIIYFLVSALYRFALNDGQRVQFEKLVVLFNEYNRLIPLTFLLGFYISSIVQRWWKQFELVAWPDNMLNMINFVVPGVDEMAVKKRHQIARYSCLTLALCWRDISVMVRSRFPTIETVVRCGLMTEDELALYNGVQATSIRWELPLAWIQKLLRRELTDGKIPPPIAGACLAQLNDFRDKCRQLYCYDWVCIPLVYTQVTALATYGYFAIALIGMQFLDTSKNIKGHEIDFIVPIFTILLFTFYVGWFKVGQELMRPFGTDDDDIELNYILDRHVRAAFALVKIAAEQEPAVVDDYFTNQPVAILPHTKMSSTLRDHQPKLHAFVKVKKPSDVEVVERGVLKSKVTRINDVIGDKLGLQRKPKNYF